MSTTVNAVLTLAQRKYSNTLELLFQQKVHALEGTYMPGEQSSQIDYVENQLSVDSWVSMTSTTSENEYGSSTFNRRQLTLVPYQYARKQGREIDVNMMIDIKSGLMQSGVYGLNRLKDDIILKALRGTCYADNTGSGTPSAVVLPSAQKVASDLEVSGTHTNLTYKKLVEAEKILGVGNVPQDLRRYIAIGPKQKAFIATVAEFTNKDYNNGSSVTTTGKIPPLNGFEAREVDASLIPVSGNYNYIMVWVKEALKFHRGAGSYDAAPRLDQLINNHFAWQIYMDGWYGATRLQEKGVVEIAVDVTK